MNHNFIIFTLVSRKTKSRGRRSTVQASRSLEMFQQSLAENSENSSQDESPVSKAAATTEQSERVNEAQEEIVARTEELEILQESGNMIYEFQGVKFLFFPIFSAYSYFSYFLAISSYFSYFLAILHVTCIFIYFFSGVSFQLFIFLKWATPIIFKKFPAPFPLALFYTHIIM